SPQRPAPRPPLANCRPRAGHSQPERVPPSAPRRFPPTQRPRSADPGGMPGREPFSRNYIRRCRRLSLPCLQPLHWILHRRPPMPLAAGIVADEVAVAREGIKNAIAQCVSPVYWVTVFVQAFAWL